jgi:hypothetical protein
VLSAQARKQQELLDKMIKHIKKEIDKEDNIKRRENLKENDKEELVEKIEKDNLKKQIIE